MPKENFQGEGRPKNGQAVFDIKVFVRDITEGLRTGLEVRGAFRREADKMSVLIRENV